MASAFKQNHNVLVLGGDCTVELGTGAGALLETENIGLVYIDLDTDLNTPESVEDGALDWMGVAHMLGLNDANQKLVNLGPQVPLLKPEQILFFANGNSTSFEKQAIEELGIEDVIKDPGDAARSVIDTWGKNFDRLLIHLDVDVLDYIDMPLAENTRRNQGLKFDQLILH